MATLFLIDPLRPNVETAWHDCVSAKFTVIQSEWTFETEEGSGGFPPDLVTAMDPAPGTWALAVVFSDLSANISSAPSHSKCHHSQVPSLPPAIVINPRIRYSYLVQTWWERLQMVNAIVFVAN